MSDREHKNALPIDYLIEGYKIEALLGHGGFGLTYLARDTDLDMLVAIKEYLPQESAVRDADNFVVAKSSRDEELYLWGLKKFKAEAQTLAKFDHHNIVDVLRIFEKNNTAYLVMKYVQGQSLGDYIRNNGYGLTEKHLKSIFLPILDGLRAVHSKGLLHCDIKPDNIFICDDRSPILLDFGSARFAMGNKSHSANLVVSEGYAPHELYSITGNHGAWTDIYSFAASLYFCITGQPVPSALDRNTALLENESDIYQSIQTLTKEKYSDSFLASIDVALSIRIKDRPQTVHDFQQKFMSIDSAESRESQPTKSKQNFSYKKGEHKRNDGFFNHLLEKKVLNLFKKVFIKTKTIIVKLRIALSIGAVCILLAFFFINAKKNSDLQESKNRLITLECEQLAGAFNQKDIASAGLKLEEINAEKAVPACEKALQLEPDNAKLQTLLGRAYFVQKDFARAFKKFNLAANQQYALAENSLGGMYTYGYGVPKDLNKAFFWFKKAAEQNLETAQTNIGIMYYYGRSVPRDINKARDWFIKAVEQGEPKAQNFLGIIYKNGEGVSKNEDKAFELFSQAAKQGHANAQANLGWAYQNGKGVAKNVKTAIQWYLNAVKKGDANAQYFLGMLYFNGNKLPRNLKRADKLFNMAAVQGQADAQYRLGLNYEVINDFKLAVSWYEKAVDQNHPYAQYRLGNFYYYGQGVREDIKKGKMLITQAANQKVAEAIKFLKSL